MFLSKHFCENWASRVGGTPTPEMVDQIIAGSVWVQRQARVRCSDGTVHSTLAIYWHPELNVIIKTDPSTNVAVTVLGKGEKYQRGMKCPKKKQRSIGNSTRPGCL